LFSTTLISAILNILHSEVPKSGIFSEDHFTPIWDAGRTAEPERSANESSLVNAIAHHRGKEVADRGNLNLNGTRSVGNP
jgi:hypothetical protein